MQKVAADDDAILEFAVSSMSMLALAFFDLLQHTNYNTNNNYS